MRRLRAKLGDLEQLIGTVRNVGYRWQRDDRGNLLLVAIATGIIADLVLNN